ncbi:MAG: cell division topological specificity factor MinE [Clostridia bacterium]|nr:cell division topological specificity factor MinE [Clostridia bacterium]
MGWFFNRKKSSQVAKDRLKLVLIYDRAGTTHNDELIEMMKKDIMQVISRYVEIEEQEFEMDLRNVSNEDAGVSSQLVANIPIRRIKQLNRNAARK